MGVLIESAIRAALLALAAFAVLRVLRVTTPAARHAVWTVVLAGMVVLPVWTLWGPKASIPVVSPAVRMSHSAVPAVMWTSGATSVDPVIQHEFPTVRTEIATPTPQREGRGIPWRPVVLTIYAVGVALLFGRLIVGTLRAQRLTRQTVPRSGFLISGACSAPVTVGWLRPVVVLPEGYESWSSAQFEAVMLHEQEHARRRDPLVQWIALANRAVFWFHPLAWWLERHLAELSEEACDTAVLLGGHKPADYCEYLLSMARAVGAAGVRVDVVGAAMPGAFLSQRIGRILGAAPESRLSAWRLVFILAVCVGLSAVVIAGTPAPAVGTPRAVPVQSVAGQLLPDDWFADDEWHLETAPLMSELEIEQYKALRTSVDRDAFITAFWKRHDPTAGTSANEFRREFERRIRYAKEQYADPDSAATFGYQTDRGRWYVMFGQPDATRVFGNRGVDANGRSSRTEEWDYQSHDDLGSNVTVKFDLGSYFGCSWRGGKYRIVSPAPVSRFDGVTSGGSDRRPFAQTYPGHFVFLSFPIDEQAVAIRWGMRTGRDGQLVLDDDSGPIDYVQGEIGSVSDDPTRPARDRSRPVQKILEHLQGLQFFEANGIACTEQLPPATYTLRIESRLLNGAMRTDSVTFKVD